MFKIITFFMVTLFVGLYVQVSILLTRVCYRFPSSSCIVCPLNYRFWLPFWYLPYFFEQIKQTNEFSFFLFKMRFPHKCEFRHFFLSNLVIEFKFHQYNRHTMSLSRLNMFLFCVFI